MFSSHISRYLANSRCLRTLLSRNLSKERAGKGVRPGVALLINDSPHKVMKIIQGKRGKGGGFVKATLKAITSGSTFEKTFTSDELVELAELETESAHYSWSDGDNYVFMNTETFEETVVAKDSLDQNEFLVEGIEVKLLKFRGEVLGMTLPIVAEYTVRRINEQQSSGKENAALLNSGAIVMIPEFIEEGAKIKVNTESRTYVSKVD